MKNIHRIIVCLMLLNGIYLIQAAPNTFRNHIFTSADGLPGNTVFDLAFDSQGYLIAGTENGLAQFDGTQFTVINKWNTPAFSSNTVKSIISAGPFLYARLKTGQIVLKHGSLVSELPINTERSFSGWTRDPQNNIWIVYNNSCGILSPSGYKPIVSGSSTSFISVYPHFSEGILVITNKNTLLHITEKRSVPVLLPEHMGDKPINTILHASEHMIALGADSEIMFLNISTGDVTSESIDSIGIIQHIVHDTHSDSFWCSGPGGLFFRSEGQWQPPHLSLGLPSEVITCIKMDSSGTLWAGTENGGIVSIQNSFIHTPPLLSREMRYIVVKGNDCIYTATLSGIKKIKVNCSQSSFIIEKNIISPKPNTLLEDSKHRLWIGTDSGLSILLDNQLKHIQDIHSTVYCLLKASDSHSIFAGTSDGMYQIFEDFSVVQFNEWKPYTITSLSEDSSGTLWAGTAHHGVIHFSNNTCEQFDDSEGLFSNSIHSLFTDSRHVIWVCHAEESLQIIRKKHVHDLHIKNLSHGIIAKAVAEDALNNIWLATLSGLIVIPAKEIEKISLNSEINAVIINEYDGLPSAECTGSLFLTNDLTDEDHMLADTIKGMALIHLNLWQHTVERSDCALTLQSVRVNNTPVSHPRLMTVDEGSAVQFTLNPFSLSAPGGLALSYTLDGYSNEWKTSYSKNDNSLFFLNLKKGSYVLKATALNRWGQENSIEFPFKVSGTSNIKIILYSLLLIIVCIGTFLLLKKRMRNDHSIQSEKYASSGLDETEGQQQFNRLDEAMKNQQLFLQQGITLNTVSEEMDIHPKHLSQIVNQFSGFNFNDYINNYRVEEAKRILSDSSYNSLTLLAIGEECGFNSKTSFNTAFKKHTGMTPSQFRKTSEKPLS